MPPDEETAVEIGPNPLTIHQALSGVMGEVQSVGKESRNTQQGYNFRGVDAVVNAVGPALRRWGVIVVPVEAGYDAEHFTTKKGTEMRSVTVRVAFRFYGPAGDYIDAMALGESADSGDKAIPKAHSVAYRTLLLQALCIPTDEPDPDAASVERGARREAGQPQVPVPKSWTELEANVRGCDNPDEAWALFQAFLRAAAYHLFGETDQAKLDQPQRDTLWQKAAGAQIWMLENRQPDAAFQYHDENLIRRAWAFVLDAAVLKIPDYEPPAAAQAEADQFDEDAARIAAEVFAEDADQDVAADYS